MFLGNGRGQDFSTPGVGGGPWGGYSAEKGSMWDWVREGLNFTSAASMRCPVADCRASYSWVLESGVKNESFLLAMVTRSGPFYIPSGAERH